MKSMPVMTLAQKMAEYEIGLAIRWELQEIPVNQWLDIGVDPEKTGVYRLRGKFDHRIFTYSKFDNGFWHRTNDRPPTAIAETRKSEAIYLRPEEIEWFNGIPES